MTEQIDFTKFKYFEWRDGMRRVSDGARLNEGALWGGGPAEYSDGSRGGPTADDTPDETDPATLRLLLEIVRDWFGPKYFVNMSVRRSESELRVYSGTHFWQAFFTGDSEPHALAKSFEYMEQNERPEQ